MPGRKILVGVKDGVLHLTINRPQTLNLLDVATRKEILRALKAHRKDAKVRCVVVSAPGKVFSAGADIKFLLQLDEVKAKKYTKFVRSFLDYLEGYPKPTIGEIEGVAVGGGLELLLALDIVIAGTDAKFGQTELNVGLIPGGGGTQRLPRIVGVRRGKEMIFTGNLISAQEAMEIGLVNKVVPTGDLTEEVKKLCEGIMRKSPESLRMAKEAINETYSMPLREGLDFENEMYPAVLTSAEGRRRMRSFLDKRKEPRAKA